MRAWETGHDSPVFSWEGMKKLLEFVQQRLSTIGADPPQSAFTMKWCPRQAEDRAQSTSGKPTSGPSTARGSSLMAPRALWLLHL